MTTTEATWTTESVRVAGQALPFRKGGSGDPLLVLHHDIGSPERLPFYDAAGRAASPCYLPSHPGYDGSERPGLAAQRARRRGDLPVRCSPSAGSPASRWSGSASGAGSPPRWPRMAPRGVPPAGPRRRHGHQARARARSSTRRS